MFLLRWLFRLVVTLVALAAVAAIAVALLPAFGEVSPEALNHSVTRAVGGSISDDVLPCRGRGRRSACSVRRQEGRGRARYRVTVRSRRCWTARRQSPSSPGGEGQALKREATGCVGLADQVRPFGRLP